MISVGAQFWRDSMAKRIEAPRLSLSGRTSIIGSINVGRFVLLATALVANSISPAVAAPMCNLHLYCPQKIYAPPDFHMQCDLAAQFSQVSPVGTSTVLGFGKDWYGTTVLYHVVIEACVGLGPQACTGKSIAVTQAQFCAPPPPPGGTGGSAKGCSSAGGT
jgi:hypothetical protein